MSLQVDSSARTIAASLTSGAVTLREPTVGEWRQIRTAYADASVAVAEGGEDAVWGDVPAFAHAFALTVGLLSDSAEPDADKLPMWASSVDCYVEMRSLWSTPEVTRPEQATGLDWFTPIPDDDDGEVES